MNALSASQGTRLPEEMVIPHAIGNKVINQINYAKENINPLSAVPALVLYEFAGPEVAERYLEQQKPLSDILMATGSMQGDKNSLPSLSSGRSITEEYSGSRCEKLFLGWGLRVYVQTPTFS
jgi:hypothetical protein